jgi:FtsZ-interacting cell division protein ZipA
MSTTEIIWIIVIAVAALVLIGLIVVSMRKKSVADNREQAALLRERADTQAADLPDAQARAEQAATQAEHARLEAQRAEERAAAVRTEADQQRAIHEDQIRAADRLDPDVDTQAPDYSPDVVDPAGPSDVPADAAYADPDTGRVSVRHRLEGDAPEESDDQPDGGGGTHRT